YLRYSPACRNRSYRSFFELEDRAIPPSGHDEGGSTMGKQSDFRFFRDDLCDRCGVCLMRCPVLELPEDETRRQIQTLISGHRDDSLVLQRCVTCNICDFACPRHANPYGLVLERHNETGRADGLPYMAKFIFPNEPENMWTTTRVLMEKD